MRDPLRDPVVIPAFPDYRVWDNGVVESKKRGGTWKPLKPIVNRNSGALHVKLSNGFGKSTRQHIHRLVLEAFVGQRPPGKICRHKNGVPSDNRVENLSWGTPRQNIMDKFEHGTMRKLNPRNTKSCKLTEDQVIKIREQYREGASLKELAAIYGVSPLTVRNVVIGWSWNHVDGFTVKARSHKSRRFDENQRRNARFLCALGFSIRQVAEWVGVHRNTVNRAIAENNARILPSRQ